MKQSSRYIFTAINSVASLIYLALSAANPVNLPGALFGIVSLILALYAGIPWKVPRPDLAYLSSSTMLAFGGFAVSYVTGSYFQLYGGSENLFISIASALSAVLFMMLELFYRASS